MGDFRFLGGEKRFRTSHIPFACAIFICFGILIKCIMRVLVVMAMVLPYMFAIDAYMLAQFSEHLRTPVEQSLRRHWVAFDKSILHITHKCRESLWRSSSINNGALKYFLAENKAISRNALKIVLFTWWCLLRIVCVRYILCYSFRCCQHLQVYTWYIFFSVFRIT